MAQNTVFIIEDDKHLLKLLKYNLEKAQFNCVTATSGEEALETLSRIPADLIILDIMLPKMDGFEVCRLIRQEERLKAIPIIMLTAKGEEVDRVVGLELGADDYMVKPFSPRELILRIKAILRRSQPEPAASESIQQGDLFIDISKHKVTVKNKEVILTPIEFKLLVTLIQRHGRIQSRDKLLSDVWDIHSAIYTRTVDTHIKRLREKLGKIGDSIETVRGFGYRFKEDDDEG